MRNHYWNHWWPYFIEKWMRQSQCVKPYIPRLPFGILSDHGTRNNGFYEMSNIPYPEPVVFQWQSSGNPVCLELRPSVHWNATGKRIVGSQFPVCFQWSSIGFSVVFQCVPIMQINTGSPLGHHWMLASASVVPVAFQCTCGSSGLPVCSN